MSSTLTLYQITTDKEHRHCIPRVATIQLQKLELFSSFFPPGNNLLKLVVQFKKFGKKNLTTPDIEVNISENTNVFVELNLSFFLQYMHFVKKNIDILEIVLKRKSKQSWKNIGSVAINMAYIVQCSFDDTLELKMKEKQSLSKKQSAQQANSNPTNTSSFNASSPVGISDAYITSDTNNSSDFVDGEKRLKTTARLKCRIESKPLTGTQLEAFKKKQKQIKKKQQQNAKSVLPSPVLYSNIPTIQASNPLPYVPSPIIPSISINQTSSPIISGIAPAVSTAPKLLSTNVDVNEQTKRGMMKRSYSNLVLYEIDEEEDHHKAPPYPTTNFSKKEDEEDDENSSTSTTNDESLEEGFVNLPNTNNTNEDWTIIQQVPAIGSSLSRHNSLQGNSISNNGPGSPRLPQQQQMLPATNIALSSTPPMKKDFTKAFKDFVKGLTRKKQTSPALTNRDSVNTTRSAKITQVASPITPATTTIAPTTLSTSNSGVFFSTSSPRNEESATIFEDAVGSVSMEQQMEKILAVCEAFNGYPIILLMNCKSKPISRFARILLSSENSLHPFLAMTRTTEEINYFITKLFQYAKKRSSIMMTNEEHLESTSGEDFLKLLVVGDDTYVNEVFRACFATTSNNNFKTWPLYRLYHIPIPTMPTISTTATNFFSTVVSDLELNNSITVAYFLAQNDTLYQNLFFGPKWKQLCSLLQQQQIVTTDTKSIVQIAEYCIMEYLEKAEQCLKLPTSTVLLVLDASNESVSSSAEMQTTIPFLKSVQIFGTNVTYKQVEEYMGVNNVNSSNNTSPFLQEKTEMSTLEAMATTVVEEEEEKKSDAIELKLDYWINITGKQQSIKNAFQYLALYKLTDKMLEREKRLLSSNTTQPMELYSQGLSLLYLKPKNSDFKKKKKSDKAFKLEMGINKLTCAVVEKKKSCTVVVDGVEFMNVKFLSIASVSNVNLYVPFAKCDTNSTTTTNNLLESSNLE